MKKPDFIDHFLRDSLVNWALEDLQHPIKRATLEQMSRVDWQEQLYRGENEKETMNNWQPSIREMIRLNGRDEDELKISKFKEEEWIQALLKAFFYALKERYHTKFEATPWKMRRINTTGMYILGPMNADKEIFFRFKVGVKNGMVYWDMENGLGKIRPKGFEDVPKILQETLRLGGYDLLIRKISKSFGIMLPSGKTSHKLLIRLRQMKEMAINIGSDAHGMLWIQDDRKRKKLRLTPVTNSTHPKWVVLEKETDTVLAEVADTDDVLSLKKRLTSYDSFL